MSLIVFLRPCRPFKKVPRWLHFRSKFDLKSMQRVIQEGINKKHSFVDCFLHHFGSLRPSLGDPFGALGVPLGPLWVPKGCSWDVLGALVALWGMLGAPRVHSYDALGALGPSWGSPRPPKRAWHLDGVRILTCVRCCLYLASERVSGAPWARWGRPGGLLGFLWAHMGRPWALWGHPWSAFGRPLGPIGRFGGALGRS